MKPRAKSCRRSPRPRPRFALTRLLASLREVVLLAPAKQGFQSVTSILSASVAGSEVTSGCTENVSRKGDPKRLFEFFRKDCWLARHSRFSSPSYWSTSTSFSRFPPWRTAYLPAVLADTFSEVHSYAMGTISLAMPFGRHPNLSHGVESKH